MTFDQLKEKALSLPLKPGVYLMMDREGTVIYVGKAKALKNRVYRQHSIKKQWNVWLTEDFRKL